MGEMGRRASCVIVTSDEAQFPHCGSGYGTLQQSCVISRANSSLEKGTLELVSFTRVV